MSYIQRYAAFIDILGFGEIIRRSEHNERLADELVTVLRSMASRDKPLEAVLGEDFRAQNFSDTVLMSESVTAHGLSHLCYQIQELALGLLRKGLLIRGGISKGLLHHDESVVLGPALIEAYRLESAVAHFPRVILGRDVYADLTRYKSDDDRWAHDFDRDLWLSTDGPVYVHVLKRFQELNRRDSTLTPLDTEEVVHAQLCQSALQNLLDNSMHEPRHFEKVKWFAIYWNETIPGGPRAPLGMVSFPYMHMPQR